MLSYYPAYPNGPTPPLPIAGAGYGDKRQNLNEIVLRSQTTPVAKVAAANLTPAELAAGIITYNGATANLTLPTVAALEAAGALSNAQVNDSFEFVVLDLGGAGRPTIVTNTGWTLAGSMVNTAANLPAVYRARKTNASGTTSAWTLYRVG